MSKGRHDDFPNLLLGGGNRPVTLVLPDVCDTVVADRGVYAPQQDSRLLVEEMERAGLARGRRVLDLCTGTGVLALGAAAAGAAHVTAFDICSRAVRCAAANAAALSLDVDVRLGSLDEALQCEPFDLVISNPPYVPVAADSGGETIPATAGPAWAWDAGEDGRLVLDPLCRVAADLLRPRGTVLIVHSEFSGAPTTVAALIAVGFDARVVASRVIPFGPVMSARADWLEARGHLTPGRREERLVVVRGDRRD